MSPLGVCIYGHVVITLQLNKGEDTLVIVDEVGKMELFSQNFVKSVQELFSSSNVRVLATVPVTKQHPIPFVDELKKREDVTLIEVSISPLQLVNHMVEKRLGGPHAMHWDKTSKN